MKEVSVTYGLDEVNISFLPNPTSSDRKLPLVITPRWERSLSFISKWSEKNRDWLDSKLLEYGAILLRGFDLKSPVDMEKVIRSYQPKLNDTYRGTSPRRLMDGTNFMFSAAEVPTNYPIAQHLEMSFLDAPPKQLYFGCVQPSRTAGGETSVADFRQVYQDIPVALKEKLLQKGIRYTRTHRKVGANYTFDVSDMLGWPELFGTSDKKEVERICSEEGVPVTWDGDTFVSTTQSHAFQLHPVTKELVWFNHIQVFHWTTFPAELFFSFQRTWDVRFLIHAIVIAIFSIIKYGILGHKMSLDCTFGDGEAISVLEMHQIRNAIHKNLVFSRWEKSDLMLLDNFSTSHGRQPTYDSNRKVVVAWADPIQKGNQVTSLKVMKETLEGFGDNDENTSVTMSSGCNTPEGSSPSVTPTKQDLALLRSGLLDQKVIEKLNALSHEQKERQLEHKLRLRKLHKKTNSEPYIFATDGSFWKED